MVNKDEYITTRRVAVARRRRR